MYLTASVRQGRPYSASAAFPFSVTTVQTSNSVSVFFNCVVLDVCPVKSVFTLSDPAVKVVRDLDHAFSRKVQTCSPGDSAVPADPSQVALTERRWCSTAQQTGD